MSALPPKADMCGAGCNVDYGPQADIAVAELLRLGCWGAGSLAVPELAVMEPSDSSTRRNKV
jgi:hypothetical protein